MSRNYNCVGMREVGKIAFLLPPMRKFDQSSFVGVSFVSFYEMAESVSQLMRNCVCKTQTATTGTRPPPVASL